MTMSLRGCVAAEAISLLKIEIATPEFGRLAMTVVL